ncbi:hypothetical protein AB1286_03685 [Trinickia sp. NRRL B-1857]|uniref:hypothetical protein n=1 Tax=Trinickia sp. NRRL B-1857 TaxID=3162879 RepID=UPI003D2ABFA6
MNRELEGMFESDRDAGGAIAANDAGHATRSPPSSGFSTPTRVPGTPTRSDPVHAFLRDWQPPAEWRLGERQVSPVPLTETEFDPASPAQHDPGSPASTIAYLGSPSPPPSELPTFREVMREAIDRRAEISLPEVRLYWPNPSYDDALSRQQLTLSLVRVLQENRVPARYLQGNLPIDTLSRRLGYGSSTLGKMRISYQDQVDLGKPVFERKAELLWWLGYIE